jgi:hypothetical protein
MIAQGQKPSKRWREAVVPKLNKAIRASQVLETKERASQVLAMLKSKADAASILATLLSEAEQTPTESPAPRSLADTLFKLFAVGGSKAVLASISDPVQRNLCESLFLKNPLTAPSSGFLADLENEMLLRQVESLLQSDTNEPKSTGPNPESKGSDQ